MDTLVLVLISVVFYVAGIYREKINTRNRLLKVLRDQTIAIARLCEKAKEQKIDVYDLTLRELLNDYDQFSSNNEET